MANDEFGDFQTPLPLARQLMSLLPASGWSRVLEPTCGVGNFLCAAVDYFSHDKSVMARGIEIQPAYAAAASSYAPVDERDIFETNLAKDVPWENQGRLLVVGNPPWVTNAALTRLGSENRPVRENLKLLTGLDALTGASNFDIAEFIWIKLIRELASEDVTIALLCKTQVARNVLSYCEQQKLPTASSRLYRINALKWFNAGVDACFFVMDLSPGSSNYYCDIYENTDAPVAQSRIAVIDGRLVADATAYETAMHLEGLSPIMWRQGIKHDATAVMELVEDDGPRMKSGPAVEVEPDYCLPLVKCTDLFRGRHTGLTKWMIVPNRDLKDSMVALRTVAPKLWTYLTQHGEVLDSRKSSIYKNRPRFTVFGVGDYSFLPYKVAISGMHKQAVFRLVCPMNDQPVVFDDTCYFLAFGTIEDAAVVLAILESAPAKELLNALAFWDAKRPITKKLLQRLDLLAIAKVCEASDLIEAASAHLREVGSGNSTTSHIASRLEELKRSWAGLDTSDDGVLLLDLTSGVTAPA